MNHYCFDDVLPKYTEKELLEIKTGIHIPTLEELGPYGTQKVSDEQTDDIITEIENERSERFKKLCKIELPQQRSHEWYEMRNNRITASDIGTLLDMNKNEQQYNVILKKVLKIKNETKTGLKFCYHGKKYENIAALIYKHRMNISIKDFGLIGHPEYEFLGASPDGICTEYKYDEKHLSKFVGRMIEIKCPLIREIKTSGDDICPPHYWAQIQIQLQCCNLDECDFWQCKITEYGTKKKFIEDTNEKEPYKSLTTGFEKGCLIEIMPKDIEMNDMNIYEHAQFVYPPKVEMSPDECEEWIQSYKCDDDYVINKVIYWRLCKSSCITIYRDNEWFNKNIPTLQDIWKKILILRQDSEKSNKLKEYIDSMVRKNNKNIMNYIDELTKL